MNASLFRNIRVSFFTLGLVALSGSAHARDHVHVGVGVGIGSGVGVGISAGNFHGGSHRSGYYSRGGYYRNSCGPYRLSHGFYAPSVVYYSSPEYIYVEPPARRVIVQSAPETVIQSEPEVVSPPAGSPPPYGGRIGNSDEVKSPYSNFQLKTRAARNTVVYDAYTGQAFRVP